jgi:hypothetical protein
VKAVSFVVGASTRFVKAIAFGAST